MNANTYGNTHFKYKINFGSIVVFSDDENKIPPQEELARSDNQYVHIYQSTETNQWVAKRLDTLSGEYGDFVINTKNLEPIGTIEASQLTFFLTEDQQVQYGDLLMDYYLIDNKFYLQVNAVVSLDPVIITGEDFEGIDPSEITPLDLLPVEEREYTEVFVTVFVSSDGAKLERAYQQIDDIKHREMIILAEKDDSTNWFGSVFRVNTGKLLSNHSIYPKSELSRILRSYTTDPNLTLSALSSLISEYFKEKDSDDFFLWTPRLATSFIRLASKYTLEPLGEAMYEISKAINDDLRLGENRWKATINDEPNEKYNPILPGYQLLTDDKIITKITSKINKKFIEPLSKPIAKLIRKLRRNKLVKHFLGNKLDSLLHFVESLPEYLTSIVKSIFQFLQNAFEFFNALLVGIINSIVDLLKSIFDILGLIFKGLYAVTDLVDNIAAKPSSYLGLIVESFENVISILNSVFTLNNLKAFIGFQLFIIESVGKLGFLLIDKVVKGFTQENQETEAQQTEEDKSLPYDSIGYYTGYIIGFIAQEVAIFMLTAGVGTVAKGIQGTVRSYAELGRAIGRATKTTAKAVHKATTFTIDTFLRALRALKQFAKQIPKHLDTVKSWITDLIAGIGSTINTVFKQFKAAIELLRDVGVVIVDDLTTRPLFIGQGLDGNYYAIKYNGDTIVQGSKKAVEDFLNKIEDIRKSGGNVKAKVKHYLDELAGSLNAKYFEMLNKRGFVVIKAKGAKTNLTVVEKLDDGSEAIRFIGKEDEIEAYLKVMSKTDETIIADFENIVKTSKEFDILKDKLKPFRDKGIDIGKSVGNGFFGLVPDFRLAKQFLYKGDLKFGNVKIKLTGVDAKDFELCNELFKFSKTPNNYTWHHMDDFNPITGECTMQLVKQGVHEATFPHKGGAGLFMELLGLKRK